MTAPAPSRGRVLVVDDQPAFRRLLRRILGDDGYQVAEAADGREALALARRDPPDLVLTDVDMPALDGMALLRRLRAERPDVAVILITAYGSVPDAVEAMKLGAFDYLAKPLEDPEQLRLRVAAALAERRAGPHGDAREGDGEGEAELLYGSPAMAAVAEAVGRVAAVDATVLLTGESGTGKEVVARLLHARSPRAGRPFVAVSCAALAEGLLEAELFGHERGAFTGADRRRAGRFEVADGGTLFLDEVGETSPALQAKLLRVLQERAFERVGGTETVAVDVRLVAATNRDLEAEVAAGRFRSDLYFRLAVVPLHLPPLRERGDDAVLLARHFLGRLGERYARPGLRLGEDAEAALRAHPWPGNVRELRNVVERAVVLCRGPEVTPRDLALAGAGAPAGPARPLNLKALERDAIARALAQVDGNRRQTAELLGISLRTLHYKLNDYDLR